MPPTEEIIFEFQEVFNLFDEDKDGIIPLKDIGTLMRSIGGLPTENYLKDLVRDIEENYNGILDFQCFLKIMERQYFEDERLSDKEMVFMDAFLPYDRDGNGYVSISDLEKIVGSIREYISLTDEELDEIIRATCYNTDGDREINYHDLVKFLI